MHSYIWFDPIMLFWFISDCVILLCTVFSEHNLYSAKAVRFRMGHVKEPQRERYLTSDYGAGKSIEDHVVWTYTSKKFPMRQVCFVILKMHLSIVQIVTDGVITNITILRSNRMAICRSSSYQNLFWPLVDFCRLNCWVASSLE